jgi:Na+/melibiose symporter-like transporter
MATLYPSPLVKLRTRTKLSSYLFVVAVSAILLLFLVIATILDGAIREVVFEGGWRTMLLPAVIIIYIVALDTPLRDYRTDAVEAFRQLVLIGDEAFEQLVQEASDVDDRSELIAFLVGAAFGVWSNGPWHITEEFFWLKAYFVVVGALMFGLLAWIAFTSLAGTKLDAVLHEQPLDIDIFDVRPFLPIGRYSLFSALAFVGGSVISILFLGPSQEIFNIAALGLYGVLGLVALLVFFLGTRHTHRVLKNAKEREKREIRQHISDAFRALRNEDKDVAAISTELNLWLKYEDRLKVARTWPYNTTMLRTLFVSVLFPIIASLAQRIIANLLAN